MQPPGWVRQRGRRRPAAATAPSDIACSGVCIHPSACLGEDGQILYDRCIIEVVNPRREQAPSKAAVAWAAGECVYGLMS
jgi:hypothetical protein